MDCEIVSYAATREAVLLVFALGIACLAVIAQQTEFFQRAVLWLRRDPLVRMLLVIGLFNAGTITLRSKNGAPSRSAQTTLTADIIPPFVCHEARTNGVAMVAPTTNAVVSQSFLRHGVSEQGEWIESDAPFFRWGTNDIRRLYASPGCLSFETKCHPHLGDPLPNGTDAESLVVLRTPLGIVPEANWHLLEGTGVVSRFWHDAVPGGGRVFTWENALLDRLPGRPATIQAELRPNGDFVYRYDFSRAMPTNVCLIGAQRGAAAVEALRIGPFPEGAVGGADWGCQTNGATIWRIDGNPNTNGVSIADIFSTSPLVELRWKNTADLGDLALDPDGDGISSHDEILLYNIDPLVADTDADGIADNVELMAGTDPLDADENGDGVPDGVPAADWAAHPLWATNSVDGANVAVTLNEAIPQGASATLVMGGLCIPLRSPGAWAFAFEPGVAYGYRLVVSRGAAADLSIAAANPEGGLRGGGGTPVWAEGGGGVFNGPSAGGAGKAAVPEITFTWSTPNGTGHSSREGVCLHAGDEVLFEPSVAPSEIEGRWVLENLREGDGGYILDVPDSECVYVGSVSLHPDLLRDGALQMTFFAHQCDAEQTSPFCSYCGCYAWTDAELHVSSSLLTLKHDNQLDLSILHNFSPNVGYSDVRFEIRERGLSGWQPISGNTWTARIAGTFEVRGHATADGRDVDVGPVVVQVRFPSEAEMMADPAIQSHAASLWAQTLSLCTPTNRHEVGCWIRLDTSSDTYSFTTTMIGTPTPNDQASNINLLPVPVDSPLFPRLANGSAIYTVASLHTHTPTVHLSGDPRIAGPSPVDENASTALSMPGLVHDYVDSAVLPGMIPMGLPLNAPTLLYPTAVCPRRIHP